MIPKIPPPHPPKKTETNLHFLEGLLGRGYTFYWQPHWRGNTVICDVLAHISLFLPSLLLRGAQYHVNTAVRTLKPYSKKKCFERIPSRPESACKFADWFSSVFQSLQMHCRVFCNLADSSSVKTNQEIKISTAQKKIQTCSYSGPGTSDKTKETKVIQP